MAEPRHACDFLPPPPALNSESSFVLLATEDGCDLFTKTVYAKEANYHSIIIIMNTKHPTILHIDEEYLEYINTLTIDVSFIGVAAGKKLEAFVYDPTSNARQV